MAEPWYHATRLAALTPLHLWFSQRFEGLELLPASGPAIVAANHISYLDPLTSADAVIRAGRRPRFLAKAELFGVPVLGRAMRGANQIPVVRGTGDPNALRLAEEALGRGEVVVIYPEGTVTRRPDGMPMEAKTGAVRLCLATGVPIWPLASWGSQDVWQKAGRGSLRPGRPLWIRFGEPLSFAGRGAEPPAQTDHDTLHALTAELMAAITHLVADLRARYPAAWTPRSVAPMGNDPPG